jgi:hypothetical protein
MRDWVERDLREVMEVLCKKGHRALDWRAMDSMAGLGCVLLEKLANYRLTRYEVWEMKKKKKKLFSEKFLGFANINKPSASTIFGRYTCSDHLELRGF